MNRDRKRPVSLLFVMVCLSSEGARKIHWGVWCFERFTEVVCVWNVLVLRELIRKFVMKFYLPLNVNLDENVNNE